jgi:hypothetical protein
MSFVKLAVIGKSGGTRSRLAFLLKSQENEFLIAFSCFQVVVSGIGPRPCKILPNKVIRKVSKDGTGTPCLVLFGHIGDEISKNRGKKYTELRQGMKFSLALNLVLN